MAKMPSLEEEVRVTLTVAGNEHLRLCALLRQTLPLLRNPERHSEAERIALLESIRSTLDEVSCEDADDASEEDNEADRPEKPWQ